MKQTAYYRFFLFIFPLSLLATDGWAGMRSRVCSYEASCFRQQPGYPFFQLMPGMAPTNAWASNRSSLAADLAKANLVSAAADRLRKQMGVSGAITLLGSDFAAFASPGKTQLTYQSLGENVTFNMVIGNANAVNAQTWTLPADLTNQLDDVQRRDFIPVSSIPGSLSIAGVTHANKLIAANRLFTAYQQYQLNPTEFHFLGYAVDRKIGIDYQQSSPTVGSSFALVPLTLGANYTDKRVFDDPDDEIQEVNSSAITFDGFGTLNTPNGSFQALRYTMTTTLTTYDVSDPNDPEEIDSESATQVGWVTKEGTWITANYTDYNATTKAATISNVRYTSIVNTSSLSPTFTNLCNCSR
jgi:hypothetical protein